MASNLKINLSKYEKPLTSNLEKVTQRLELSCELATLLEEKDQYSLALEWDHYFSNYSECVDSLYENEQKYFENVKGKDFSHCELRSSEKGSNDSFSFSSTSCKDREKLFRVPFVKQVMFGEDDKIGLDLISRLPSRPESDLAKLIWGFILWDAMDIVSRHWMFKSQWGEFANAFMNKFWIQEMLEEHYDRQSKAITKLLCLEENPNFACLKGSFMILSSPHYNNQVVDRLELRTTKVNQSYPSIGLGNHYRFSPFTGLVQNPHSECRRLPQDDVSTFVIGRHAEQEVQGLYTPAIQADRDDKIIGVNQSAIRFFCGQYQLYDLGTMNGTYVRIRSNEEVIMRPDDMFLVGDRNLFKVFKATLCRNRAMNSQATFSEINQDYPIPANSLVSDDDHFGFSPNQERPELVTHIHGGEYLRASMKNFNTIYGKHERHQENVTLGRHGCTFLFKDSLMSSNHCKISWKNNVGFTLSDMGSRNGTWWGVSVFKDFCIDAPSKPLTLRDEEVIKTGKNQFELNLISS